MTTRGRPLSRGRVRDYDAQWPTVAFAFASSGVGDWWGSKGIGPNPADVPGLINACGMESGDKPFVIVPNVIAGNVAAGPGQRRAFRGSFDASTGLWNEPGAKAITVPGAAGFNYTLSNKSGTFTSTGENVTQATSGATGFAAWSSSSDMVITGISGVFDSTHTITGQSSGATAKVAVSETFAAFVAGDWAVIAVSGSHKFDGTTGGSGLVQGEFYLYDGAAWAKVTDGSGVNHCPHFDILDSQFYLAISTSVMNRFRRALHQSGRPIKGYKCHFAGIWFKDSGGAEWRSASIWPQTDENALKAFISYDLHWRCRVLAAHFNGQNIEVIQTDAINEHFSQDLASLTSTAQPGMRSWLRTVPPAVLPTGQNITESPFNYAFTQITDWDMTNPGSLTFSGNRDRIIAGWQYVFQVVRKYFPRALIGFNDFTLSTGYWDQGGLNYPYTDLNSNPVTTASVFHNGNDSKKRSAMEFDLYLLMQNSTPVRLNATLDAGLPNAPPTCLGFQSHLDPTQHLNTRELMFQLSRLTHLIRPDGGVGVEPVITELNVVSETFISQVDATIKITLGVAGNTIDQVTAYRPQGQTSTGGRNLLTVPVPWTTSDANTAQLLKAAINANTAITGYTANVDTLSGDNSATVKISNQAVMGGFTLGTASTGAITLTLVSGTANGSGAVTGLPVTVIPPQFVNIWQGKYALTTSGGVSTRKISFTMGRQPPTPTPGAILDSAPLYAYGTWYAESYLATVRDYSKFRVLNIWPSDNSQQKFSAWDPTYDFRTPFYAMVQRAMHPGAALPPSQRTVKNCHRLSWVSFQRLWNGLPGGIGSFSGVSIVTTSPLLGATCTSASGANNVPWSWYAQQGLAADSSVFALQWVPYAFGTAGMVLFSLFRDSTNYVELFFKNTGDNALYLRARDGTGSLISDTLIGTVNAGEPNMVVLRVTSGGLRASLNQAAVISATPSRAVPVANYVQVQFDHSSATNAANGYLGSTVHHLDIWASADVADDAALQAFLCESDVDPAGDVVFGAKATKVWDGTGSQPPLISPLIWGTPTKETVDGITITPDVHSVSAYPGTFNLSFTEHLVSGLSTGGVELQVRGSTSDPWGVPFAVTSGSWPTWTAVTGTDLYYRLRANNVEAYGDWTVSAHITVPTSFTDNFQRLDETTTQPPWAVLTGNTASLIINDGTPGNASTGFLHYVAQSNVIIASPDLGSVTSAVQVTANMSGSNTLLYFAALQITDVNNFIGLRWSGTNLQLVEVVANVTNVLGSTPMPASPFTAAIEKISSTQVQVRTGGTLGTVGSGGTVAIAAVTFNPANTGSRHGIVSKNAAVSAAYNWTGYYSTRV